MEDIELTSDTGISLRPKHHNQPPATLLIQTLPIPLNPKREPQLQLSPRRHP